jgi:hypothetical protein
MSIVDTVREAISEITEVHEVDDGVVVSTFCLYPSGGFVQVSVRGGTNSFVVSDDGGAVQEVEAAGMVLRNPDAMVKQFVPSNCMMRGGILRSTVVSREELPVVIAAVSSASKEMADWFFAHLQIKRNRDFKQIVNAFLKKTFDHRVKHNGVIVGQSNKPHHFENVIRLDAGKILVVDPVLNDSNSRNSRLVAHLDIKNAGRSDIDQRLVIDDEDDDWLPADIQLLTLGATVVPYSRRAEVFTRLANASN